MSNTSLLEPMAPATGFDVIRPRSPAIPIVQVVLFAASLLVFACGESPSAAQVAAVQDAAVSQADPLDWVYCRGPESNGISRETGLIDRIKLSDDAGEGNILWKREDLGGRSTPIVMNGRLYTILRAEPETSREGERVVCLDANTGKTIWENRFNVWLSDVPDTRVGWSSVVGDPSTGHVYALGVCGYFQCLNGETGETIWDISLHEQFGGLSTYGGRTNFPVICDDLVIISAIVIGWGDMAKPAHRFLGFDKMTGEVVWFTGTRLLPYDTTYSAPTLTVLNGQKALVFGSGDGQIWARQPRTGSPIWHFDYSQRGINLAPLVVGDTVFAGHSEENINTTAMGSVVALNGASQGDITKSGQLWRTDELMVGKSAPLAIGDRLYCCDDRAKLHVMDMKSGERIGRPVSIGGTALRASPLFADGKIYAFSTSGWSILQPDDRRGAKHVRRGRFSSGEEVYASPICSHGTIYLQSTSALYGLRDPGKTPGVTDRPAAPVEAPVAEDPKPAHVQLVPAEALLRPGDERQLRARLFNARGQFLRESDATFTLDGPGSISDDGKFIASEGNDHTATIIHARVGDLVGQARVRTVPDLPWTFDFTGLGDPPVTWVGARYRHVVREVDGNHAMVKITTIPKGTRSRCWFGHSDLKDYTIQADVRGTISDGKMPDIGIIAQGYTLDLQGASQALEIRTWVPQRRIAKTIPFQWNPDTWYRIKLQASNEGNKAVLRGKAWPRDGEEPNEWAVVTEDESPNTSGSPGLYGNAKDAEITLDNITVTANQTGT